MSKFTDRLWRDIVREHGADLRGVERPAARPHHRLTRVLAGTGLVGVAGAGATLALVLGAASTTPAFAVTRNHDGTYSVGIRAFSAIPAANARLRALGLRARLVSVESGCSAAVGGLVLPQRVVVPAAARAKLLAAGARINPAKIPPGRMLLVPAIHYGNVVRLAQAKAVPGAVPSCLPTPAQVCMAGPANGPIPGGGPLTSTTGTTTDPTTTTATATSPTTTSTTGTGTTTTGTGTTPGKPGQVPLPPGVVMRCFAPPPVFCRIHGSGGAGAATSTTGTTTGATSTATTTTGTGTSTTGTTTTGTTTGPVATPVPGQRLAVGPCAAPPPACFGKAGVTGQVEALTPAQMAAFRAKVAAIRARLAQFRASQVSPKATTGTSTSTGTATTGTGTTTGPVTAPLPPRAVRVMPVPFGAAGVSCGPFGATGLTGVKVPPNSIGAAFAVPKPAVAKAAAAPKPASDREGARHTPRHSSRHASRRGTRHNRSR